MSIGWIYIYSNQMIMRILESNMNAVSLMIYSSSVYVEYILNIIVVNNTFVYIYFTK